MKRRGFYLGAAVLLTVSLPGLVHPAWAAPAVNQSGQKSDLVTGLNVTEETDQLILVIGDGGSKVTVSCHVKKEDGQWTELFQTTGVYGKNGAEKEKKEGDGKTPLGTYQFTMSFGTRENPGSILNYHKITPADYWVDDSESKFYNQLVNTKETKRDWRTAEWMAGGSPYYNYGLALNYNTDCIPGKGSAIFLHCMKSAADTGSAGCIRIPEEQMKLLIQSVDENTRIVIVSDISQLEYLG